MKLTTTTTTTMMMMMTTRWWTSSCSWQCRMMVLLVILSCQSNTIDAFSIITTTTRTRTTKKSVSCLHLVHQWSRPTNNKNNNENDNDNERRNEMEKLNESQQQQQQQKQQQQQQLQQQQQQQQQHRRDFLSQLATTAVATTATTTATAVVPTTSHAAACGGGTIITSTPGLLVDVPMVRLRLPAGGFGRDYLAVQLMIQGQGPFDFMVDTGLSVELMTPHLQRILAQQSQSQIKKRPSRIQGLAAGGTTTSSNIVELRGASLCCGSDGTVLPLPVLNAIVTDFPQEHLDPAHDPVEGMLGMELLSQYDVDFDFPAGRLRLYMPGTAMASILHGGTSSSNSRSASSNRVTGAWAEIPAVVINETGLIGIRVTTPGSTQPILGFIDCGSPFSVVNWQAATQYLTGFPHDRNDPMYRSGAAVMALGIDGRPLTLPTVQHVLTFAGNIQVDPNTGKPAGFAPPPADWVGWDPVAMAVGDLPAFSTVLGDGIHPYQGPAALIGLDILAQRRVIIETNGTSSRQRRIHVSPPC